MVAFVFALVLLFISVAALVFAIVFMVGLKRTEDKSKREDKKFGITVALLIFGIAFIIGGVTMVLDSYVIVPAKNLGVVNVLGNVKGSISNGFHWVSPWADVEDVDATNQTVSLTDDGNVDNGCASISVRLKSQQTACQDVFVQWEIDPNADAAELWKSYRGANNELITNIQNNVVLARLRSEMQHQFSTYDPLAVLQGGQLVDSTTLQDPVRQALIRDMPDGIKIVDFRFAGIHYSGVTQQKIDSFSQAVADTKIAQQQEQTAIAQAQANKELAADQSTNNPGVQYQNCLNLIASLAAKNQLQYFQQAGLACSGSGGASIIVGGK